MPQTSKPKRKLIGQGRAPYARGAALERRVKAKLEQSGWTVTRSAGSHSVFDLWALRPERVAFIQCKRDGAVRRADLQMMRIHGRTWRAETYVVDGKYRVRAVDRWSDGWSEWGETF